ncbi:MAG: ribose-phosphate diphosphokinase [Hadesarchaea archaeon]|nr:ribose-phosphate diphosphokinase [Hadesarchaea archaeon]
MLVIGGSTSQELGEKVSEELDCDYVDLEQKKFPDGEIYVRIPEEVEGREVVVIQSTYRPPNDHYMELFLLLDALNDLGASKVTSVIPYFAYARQDERFEPGEAVSLKTISKLIESVGADEIFMIDLHAHRIENAPEFFNVKAKNLTAAPLLARYIDDEFQLENPVVMGPDGEAEQWAKKAGEAIEADWDFMVKKRFGPEEVEITPRKLEVEDRDVLIIDDIISTGGTMVEAIKIMKDNGAKDIYVACTHPVLSGDALEKVKNAGAKEVIGTDTIPSEISVVSIAPIIAKAISQ